MVCSTDTLIENVDLMVLDMKKKYWPSYGLQHWYIDWKCGFNGLGYEKEVLTILWGELKVTSARKP